MHNDLHNALGVAVDPLGIGERRREETTLKRQRGLLSDYLDNLPVGFFSVDAEGRLQYVNRTLAGWLGAEGLKLFKVSCEDLIDTAPAAHVLHDLSEHILAVPGANGRPRLSPIFVEWMMGLPAGHVTGHGLRPSACLKILGNGVVPQQAALALRMLEAS